MISARRRGGRIEASGIDGAADRSFLNAPGERLALPFGHDGGEQNGLFGMEGDRFGLDEQPADLFRKALTALRGSGRRPLLFSPAAGGDQKKGVGVKKKRKNKSLTLEILHWMASDFLPHPLLALYTLQEVYQRTIYGSAAARTESNFFLQKKRKI